MKVTFVEQRFGPLAESIAQGKAEIQALMLFKLHVENALLNYLAGKEFGSAALQHYLFAEFKSANFQAHAGFSGRQDYKQANFVIDVRGKVPGPEGAQLVAEFCFDNRQAIPTNLVKTSLATVRFADALNTPFTFGFLLTFQASSRSICQWDSSVAEFEEYENQLNCGLDKFLLAPLFLVGFETSEKVPAEMSVGEANLLP